MCGAAAPGTLAMCGRNRCPAAKTRPRRRQRGWRAYLGPICCSIVDHAGGASAAGRSLLRGITTSRAGPGALGRQEIWPREKVGRWVASSKEHVHDGRRHGVAWARERIRPSEVGHHYRAALTPRHPIGTTAPDAPRTGAVRLSATSSRNVRDCERYWSARGHQVPYLSHHRAGIRAMIGGGKERPGAPSAGMKHVGPGCTCSSRCSLH